MKLSQLFLFFTLALTCVAIALPASGKPKGTSRTGGSRGRTRIGASGSLRHAKPGKGTKVKAGKGKGKKGKKPVGGTHKKGESITGAKATLTDIDCSANDNYQPCNTICYAALCAEPGTPTGVKLEEAPWFKTSPLVPNKNKNKIKMIEVLDPTTNTRRKVVARQLSGCYKNGKANTEWDTAKLEREQASQKSPDEWPPASSQSGGVGAFVHMTSKKANSDVGRHLSSGNVAGHVTLKNVAKADICHAIVKAQKTDGLHSANRDICGKRAQYGQYVWMGHGSQKSHFVQAGNLPKDYANKLAPKVVV